MAAELLGYGIDPPRIHAQVSAHATPGRLRFFGEVLTALEVREDGRIVVLEATPEQFQRHGLVGADTEGLVDMPRTIAGVDVVVLFSEVEPGKVKVSLRSNGRVTIDTVVARLGGGGHPHAAGAMLRASRAEARARAAGAGPHRVAVTGHGGVAHIVSGSARVGIEAARASLRSGPWPRAGELRPRGPRLRRRGGAERRGQVDAAARRGGPGAAERRSARGDVGRPGGRRVGAGARRLRLAGPRVLRGAHGGGDARVRRRARASRTGPRMRCALERVGLASRAADLVATLSSGMRQRLRLAFAVLHRPAILLLDEPGSHLDETGRALWTRSSPSTAARAGAARHQRRTEARLADSRIELRGGLGDPA
jgi:hypothetical protein